MGYECLIYQNGKRIRTYHLPLIPRIGEKIAFYSTEHHQFEEHIVTNVAYIVPQGHHFRVKIYI